MRHKHGGNIWACAKLSGEKPGSLLDFSASINPVGGFSLTQAKMSKLIIKHYPDPDYGTLREKIGSFHEVDPKNVLPGNGSVELLYLIPKALKPARVVLPLPSFSEYERVAKIENIETVFIRSLKKNSFSISIDRLTESAQAGSMIILGNPNSPTGAFFRAEALNPLIDVCEKRRVWLLVDEAFIDFIPDFRKETLLRKSVSRKYLIVVRSFTKFFSMPGLRLGYMVACRGIIRKVREVQPPWGVNAVSEFAGISCLDRVEQSDRSRQLLKKEQNYFIRAFNGSTGLKLYPSAANFFLAELLSPKLDAKTVHALLLKKKIIIRDCSSFRGLGGRFIRFSVRTREDNRVLVEKLKEILEDG